MIGFEWTDKLFQHGGKLETGCLRQHNHEHNPKFGSLTMKHMKFMKFMKYFKRLSKLSF